MQEVAEVGRAGEFDGPDGVNELQLVVGRVFGLGWLDAQVEETDAVLQLLAR